MRDHKNSTLRNLALDIQSQTGMKYTEAHRQAVKEIHVVDKSVEDYSNPAEWAEDPSYYKFLKTFDSLSTELVDVLPKLHTVLGKPWLLTREQDDSCHINPGTEVCHCFDVSLLDDTKAFYHLLRIGGELSPRLYKAADSISKSAYEPQWQMVALNSATHVKVYFESNWDDRAYVYDLTGQTFEQKKSSLIELFNVTLRDVVLDHYSRCNKGSEKASSIDKY